MDDSTEPLIRQLQIPILYSDVVENQENPVQAGKQKKKKMLQSMELMSYDEDQDAVTNQQGFILLQRTRDWYGS